MSFTAVAAIARRLLRAEFRTLALAIALSALRAAVALPAILLLVAAAAPPVLAFTVFVVTRCHV
jgi:hypothetical protein